MEQCHTVAWECALTSPPCGRSASSAMVDFWNCICILSSRPRSYYLQCGTQEALNAATAASLGCSPSSEWVSQLAAHSHPPHPVIPPPMPVVEHRLSRALLGLYPSATRLQTWYKPYDHVICKLIPLSVFIISRIIFQRKWPLWRMQTF